MGPRLRGDELWWMVILSCRTPRQNRQAAMAPSGFPCSDLGMISSTACRISSPPAGPARSPCRRSSRAASQVWICRSVALPSSTCSFAPPGRLSPSGNWISAEGVRVSAGDADVDQRSTSWPVRGRTAFCSMAHSSGASRLALPQRATQPGGGGVLAVRAVVVG